MSARLRLDLIVREYVGPRSFAKPDVRWSWRLWSGSRIVSTSGSQLYSRRTDCARGAEVGAGIADVAGALESARAGFRAYTFRTLPDGFADVEVRIIDEREAKP